MRNHSCISTPAFSAPPRDTASVRSITNRLARGQHCLYWLQTFANWFALSVTFEKQQ